MTSEDRDRVRRYVAQLDRRRATLASALEDEVAPVRELSLAERGVWVASVCRSAWAILRARQDGRDVVERREPPAADFEAVWQQLMARRRAVHPGTSS
jgi:hypothetical protein